MSKKRRNHAKYFEWSLREESNASSRNCTTVRQRQETDRRRHDQLDSAERNSTSTNQLTQFTTRHNVKLIDLFIYIPAHDVWNKMEIIIINKNSEKIRTYAPHET